MLMAVMYVVGMVLVAAAAGAVAYQIERHGVPHRFLDWARDKWFWLGKRREDGAWVQAKGTQAFRKDGKVKWWNWM